MKPPQLSADLTSWAFRAGYSVTDENGVALLYSTGGEYRYYIHKHEDGWYELSHASRAGKARFMLRASSLDILERHLYGAFGAVVRDELGLPSMRMPRHISDLAPGFRLSEMSDDGFRVLTRDDGTPVAMARDGTLSLLILVPLSHFLQLTVQELTASFLNELGSPLLPPES